MGVRDTGPSPPFMGESEGGGTEAQQNQSHVPKATEPGLEFGMSVLDQTLWAMMEFTAGTVMLESCVYPRG